MNIQLRFFASLRETLGATGSLHLPVAATVGQARDALIAQGAPFDAALARGRALRAALNKNLAPASEASKRKLIAFPNTSTPIRVIGNTNIRNPITN